MSVKTVQFFGDKVVLLDQRRLPFKEVYLEYSGVNELARAIDDMVVRGAPAIGVTAACALALGAAGLNSKDYSDFAARFEKLGALLAGTRPTAVNLFWAIKRMTRIVEQAEGKDPESIKSLLKQEAINILEEDIEINRGIGRAGQPFISDGATVLTHCNAGALACAGYGTALGVVRAAGELGKTLQIMATETRPRMQGARLTCWEMVKEGFSVTLICDTMVGYVMKTNQVDLVLVGADRIAANGDLANKIGTYQLALLAQAHGVPFYVAAPLSTIDMETNCGEDIPIEHRAEEEVTHISGQRMAAEGVGVLNPAFDVTPHEYISAIFTERGVVKPPIDQGLNRLFPRP